MFITLSSKPICLGKSHISWYKSLSAITCIDISRLRLSCSHDPGRDINTTDSTWHEKTILLSEYSGLSVIPRLGTYRQCEFVETYLLNMFMGAYRPFLFSQEDSRIERNMAAQTEQPHLFIPLPLSFRTRR